MIPPYCNDGFCGGSMPENQGNSRQTEDFRESGKKKNMTEEVDLLAKPVEENLYFPLSHRPKLLKCEDIVLPYFFFPQRWRSEIFREKSK